MPETTYLRAITRALREEMRRDSRVVVLGEDVAEGGPFGATQGLADEFGARRVRDTPISESAITGVAIGAALSGYRPVVEIMFIDFITLALDQLVNQAAKTHYMSGGQLCVPLVIRTQGGAGVRSGAQHSQSLEAWLAHVPGLKVVMPATAADAGGLLKTAIRDDNPVVMVENKALYSRREEERPELAPIPLGQARVVRAGRDLTIVATSRLVGQALLAADELEKMDIMAEVIDPRTLVPLDIGTLVDSLSRTHRLIVAHEAVSHMGFGSEIAARLQEEAFDQLDAPIVRVGAPFTPVPVSPPLEDAYVPGSRQILAAAEQIYGRSFDGTRSPGLPEGG
jgi:pyruvate dehydrogenase E1 component beta subunit